MYETTADHSCGVVALKTNDVKLLIIHKPIQAAPTSRALRESDEIASINVPADSTTINPYATEPASSRQVSFNTPTSRLNATPSRYAATAGPIATADKKTAITPSLPRK